MERGRRSVDMLLGMVALARGDVVAAHEHLLVALRSRMGHGYHGRACDTVNAIAVRCALGGDRLTAARLFGAAQATRARMRATPGIYGGYWAEQQAELRAALGDAAFDDAYGEGAELGLDEAVGAGARRGTPGPGSGLDPLQHRPVPANPPHPPPAATRQPEPNAPSQPTQPHAPNPTDPLSFVDHEVYCVSDTRAPGDQ